MNTLTSQSLVSSYQHHWLCYQQGVKYLDNLFSYFNRVPLRKYQPQHDMLPSHVTGLAPPTGPTTKQTESFIQIRLVSLQSLQTLWFPIQGVIAVQMALKVWKEGILELLRQQLGVALLEEIRR